MVINYLGGECFKIVQGDLTVAFNPPAKESALKVSKFGSDLVLVSLPHADFNGIENATFGERAPFLIAGPGEYEVHGVAIRGFGVPTRYDGKDTVNTIYSAMFEGMNLCFLGAVSDPKLPAEAKQELDDIDILFLPIGGENSLDYAAAYKLAVQLEPKIIIPMHYPSSTSGQVGIGDKDALKHFLKEAGADDVSPVDKLTLKKKDLEGKQVEIVVLSV